MRSYGNRWGKFTISGIFLEELATITSTGKWSELDALLGFMAQVLIVRAQDRPGDDGIEYMGVSRHFDEIGEGEAMPEYDINFERQRTCNACGGTKWGPPNSVGDLLNADPACQGCGAPIELSHFTTTFKGVKRWPGNVLHIPSNITDEQVANFKREWEAMLASSPHGKWIKP